MLKNVRKQVRGQLGHVVVKDVFQLLSTVEKALNMAGFYNADIEIVLDGKTILAVCQAVQFHPVSDMPLHVDFVRK